MSFLNKVTLPSTNTPDVKVSGTSFLSKVTPPTAESVQLYNQTKQTLEANKIPSLGKRILGGVKDIISEPKQPQTINPINVIDTTFGTAQETLRDTIGRFKEVVNTEGETKTKIGADVLSAGIGGANLLFAPITSTLKGLERVPGIGYLATGVNKLFGALGVVGAESADSVLRSLPISEQAKKDLELPVKELGALSAQVVAGKLGGKGYEMYKQNTTKILDVVKEEVKASAPKEGSFLTKVTKEQTPELTPIVETKQQIIQPATQETPIPTTSLTGELKPSTLTQDTAVRAVEKGITETLGELPEYRTMNMADQAVKATELIKTDPVLAKKIAMGEAPTVGDLRPASVYKALEIKARDTGDVGLTLDLAKSDLGKTLSTYGQEIKAADVIVENSPVEAIREITTARKAKYEKAIKSGAYDRDKVKINKQVKDEIKKTLPNKQTWNDFINELTC